MSSLSPSLPNPTRGEPKRCEVHNCFCIITSVQAAVWDPDYVCPLCNPEYVLPEGRFERAMVRRGFMIRELPPEAQERSKCQN